MVCRVWWAESFPSLASVTLPAHTQSALLALSRIVPFQDALEKVVAQIKFTSAEVSPPEPTR